MAGWLGLGSLALCLTFRGGSRGVVLGVSSPGAIMIDNLYGVPYSLLVGLGIRASSLSEGRKEDRSASKVLDHRPMSICPLRADDPIANAYWMREGCEFKTELLGSFYPCFDAEMQRQVNSQLSIPALRLTTHGSELLSQQGVPTQPTIC